MRTIIAGSRSITDKLQVRFAIKESGFNITEVICGGARGPDSHGKEWARNMGIPTHTFYALWKEYGKRAGILRNCEMAANADALIAVWDGKSKGTKHMIDIASNRGLAVFIYTPK